MAEYIKQKIQGGKKSICDSCTHRNVCKAIDNQPCTECNHYQCTADVEPVQRGRWEEMHYEGGILDGTNFDRCSICGYERVFDDPALKTVFKYCPNCGAKMDG